MKKIISIILNTIFRLFKIDNNKIVFESGRNLIDGNVKAIYDYLIENNIDKYKIIWLVNKNTNTSELRPGDYVYYKTIKSYYHLATAHYWIRNQSMGSLIKKRKQQIYIQLWHGNGAMKKMGYDVSNVKERNEVDHVKEWDYYIASDKIDGKHIITSSGYLGKIDVLGMASFDNTLKLTKNKNKKEEILKKIGLKKTNKKIILYVPTFRDTDLSKKIVDLPIDKLHEIKDIVLLVRLHPLVREKINLELFNYSNIINVCDYPDASDLLAISDAIITDYSSIFYQFSPLNRPIIFYPYDMEDYINLRGGFYLDYNKELPGPICYTEEQLFSVIQDIDNINKKYESKLKKFNKKYNYLADGNASKRFVDNLLNKKYDKGR